ncbi:unnamed protein product [Amoebophrya sp. A25]|nr:unnamed protein product [Amoebophrya sp. A25]|eukprot:GSA25T00012005001.1
MGEEQGKNVGDGAAKSSSSSSSTSGKSSSSRYSPRVQVALGFVSGGAGCAVSGFVTNPCDVVKIRNHQYGGEKYGNFFRTFRTVFVEEGVAGLLKGVSATVLRESTYSSVRMGLYEPIRDTISLAVTATHASGGQGGSSSSKTTASASPVVKYGSAFMSGAVGSAMFTPVDLVKIRFQSQRPTDPLPYNGSLPRAFYEIGKEKGIKGLWRGVTATTIRAAILTSSQIGTYDVVKNDLLVQKLAMRKEDRTTHFAASLITSVVATTCSNPVDIIKTMVMNDPEGKLSTFQHAVRLWQTSGPCGFLRGWMASYSRLGPHTIISFVLIERIRILMGLKTV